MPRTYKPRPRIRKTCPYCHHSFTAKATAVYCSTKCRVYASRHGHPAKKPPGIVRLGTVAEARPFVERWHYSGLMPSAKNIVFVWERGEAVDLVSHEPYAMAVYGISSSHGLHRALARDTGKDVTLDGLLELRRLCRREPREEIPLTWFLARCHKQLKKMGYRHIVSFSDPAHDHNGGVYQAASFQFLGKTRPEYHSVDGEGNLVHRKRVYNHAQRRGVSVEQARAELGLTIQKTEPKDRWFRSL